jgi:hypothetical protein
MKLAHHSKAGVRVWEIQAETIESSVSHQHQLYGEQRQQQWYVMDSSNNSSAMPRQSQAAQHQQQ